LGRLLDGALRESGDILTAGSVAARRIAMRQLDAIDDFESARPAASMMLVLMLEPR
jgi:hypothetical protein